MMRVPATLIDLVKGQTAQEPSAGARALAEMLLGRFKDDVDAILFYGSCLRKGDDEGLVDLYLLGDSQRLLAKNWTHVLLHKTFPPPTVYYIELPVGERLVRCKYAVLSLSAFTRGTSRGWFHSYLWGRFAQPTSVLYARSDEVAHQVYEALAHAVLTFVTRVMPRLPPTFGARELWEQGLSLSYRTELRAERPGVASRLFEASSEYYEQVTRAAIEAVPFPVTVIDRAAPVRYDVRIPAGTRYGSRLAWAARRMQGKVLSLLRLLKGLFTFQGGIEYVLWKIERHTGVKVDLTPRMQRHPVLAKGVMLWQLYRRGGFR